MYDVNGQGSVKYTKQYGFKFNIVLRFYQKQGLICSLRLKWSTYLVHLLIKVENNREAEYISSNLTVYLFSLNCCTGDYFLLKATHSC